MDIKDYNDFGLELEAGLKLRTHPIAVKFLESEDQIPEEAIIPHRDLGQRCAFCRAKLEARLKGRTVAMGKKDHWCWNPLVAFGQVDASVGTPAGDTICKFIGINDREKAEKFWSEFPMLPLEKYPYVVVAPLSKATFEPDVILVYADTHQTISMIGAVKGMTGQYIESKFDIIDSCVHATIEPWQTGNYKITFPDPGDRVRAMAREDEVIFTIPAVRAEEIRTGLNDKGYGCMGIMNQLAVEWEFSDVPPFYGELFEMWGLND